jgi:hypothetical protein
VPDNQPRSDVDAGKQRDQEFRVTAPQLNLPKGGGAIRGIGEKFAANPVTGTGSLTVPIYTSTGRSGFGPQLSLSYDSGSGNGPFGFGWSLGLPAITRKTDKGLPQYADSLESDIFILSGAEDLTPALVEADGHWTRDIVASRALNAGSTCLTPTIHSGAPSPRTTSQPGTARQRRAASPTRRIPAESSVGSSVKATTTRVTRSFTSTRTRTLTGSISRRPPSAIGITTVARRSATSSMSSMAIARRIFLT